MTLGLEWKPGGNRRIRMFLGMCYCKAFGMTLSCLTNQSRSMYRIFAFPPFHSLCAVRSSRVDVNTVEKASQLHLQIHQ
jgi:hypothetical protein